MSVTGATNINGIPDGGGLEEFSRLTPPIESVAIADSIMAADSAAAAAAASADSANARTDGADDAISPDTVQAVPPLPDTVPPDTLARGSGPVGADRLGRSVPERRSRFANAPTAKGSGSPGLARGRGWSRPEPTQVESM